MECPNCNIYIGLQQDDCPNCGVPLANDEQVEDDAPRGAYNAHSAQAFPPMDQLTVAPQVSEEDTILFPGKVEDPSASRYQILSEIGKGAMGVVFLAKDKNVFDRQVAIKRIHLNRFHLKDASNTSAQEVLNHFMAEPRAQANLSHSNIVHIYDCGIDAQGVYIVMEYVPGGSLQQKIDSESPLDIQTVISMAVQLCDALSEVHNRGIVHRDIKPRNILLTDRGMPKLSDFGLVLDLKENDRHNPGTFMGTRAYMSPEQKVDSSHVDAKSDIYAMGATLFACLTGLNPEHYRPDKLPEEIRGIVAKAMEENPANRYDDARCFKSALEKLLPKKAGAPGQAQAKYKCYECEKPVPYTSLYCPHCGKKLSVLREAVEQDYHEAIDQATALVEAGSFDQARKRLGRARDCLGHEHFSHYLKKTEQKLAWVDEKETDAAAREKALAGKVERAERHLEAAEIEDALEISRSVAQEQMPYFRPITDQAMRIQSTCESILAKRGALQKRIDQAVELGQKKKYDQALEILEQAAAEADICFEKISQDALQAKQRLMKQQELEKTTAANGQLASARNALENGDLDAATAIAGALKQTRDPCLHAQRQTAQQVIDQCNGIFSEKRKIAGSFQEARALAAERKYDRAIQLVEQVIQKDGVVYETERRAADKLKKMYVDKEIHEVRSRIQKTLESSEKAHWRYKRPLIEILQTEGDYLKDLQGKAYKILRRKSWSGITNAVMGCILFALFGVAVMIYPDYAVWGHQLHVIAKKVSVRPSPGTNEKATVTLDGGNEVTGYRIDHNENDEPWIFIKSRKNHISGYVNAKLLEDKKNRGVPVFPKGIISEHSVVLKHTPNKKSSSTESIQKGASVQITGYALEKRQQPIMLWFEIDHRGWVEYTQVTVIPPIRHPESLAVYIHMIPMFLVFGAAGAALIIYEKVRFLKMIKSMRFRTTPSRG